MDRLLEWLRRYWLALLLIIAFAVLIALSYNELQAIARVLLRSRWQWIAVAVILQGIYYVVYTYEYVLGFAAVGVQSRVLELLPVLFASIFVKAVIPSGASAHWPSSSRTPRGAGSRVRALPKAHF